ncbi:MAG: hypothetical protein AAFP04_12980 [Myxococcota bacterium]
MRLLYSALLGVALVAVPQFAHAQSIELSLGSGFGFGDSIDDTQRIPTNIMGTVGYELAAGLLEPQLGLVADFGDVDETDFDIQLRPQLKIAPPIIPIYGRLILSVVNIFGDGDTEVYYGGGLGLELPIPLVSPFIEAAVLPTSVEGLTVFEARIGVGF